MAERYVVFDVETPNWSNDRISSIGITVLENGRLAGEFCTLVNPETHFDRFNIQLTGITPAMVEDQPTFPELWQRIQPIMDSGVLIAHNAAFDMAVLAKCLRDYGIFWKARAVYGCTCRMARRFLPQLPNHKLDTLCSYLGIELDHHRADSDSRACAMILVHYLRSGAAVKDFLREYDLAAMKTLSPAAKKSLRR